MERMALGRRIYAVGANKTVATLAGIRADRVKIACFVIVGFCASAAGMLNAARIGAVGPTSGAGLEFEVIAAVVIGGISLDGWTGRNRTNHFWRDHHRAHSKRAQLGAHRHLLARLRDRSDHPCRGAARRASERITRAR